MAKQYKRLKLLLLLCFLTPVALAQFSVSGQITDDVNGESLIGVNVVIKGTAAGVTTDIDGNYTITIPGESETLVFTSVGYLAKEVSVDASSGTIDMALAEDVFNLQEIVVTGLASTVKRSNLANSVSSVSAKQLTGTTNQSTMDGALYGKFKGAEIRSNSGAPGGGISVKLRGVSSIFGDQQPLFIVDGVYVDNTTVSLGTNIVTAAAGGGNTSTNQDDASNRIADIDPEDIENIEILKGASAAAIYGSRAAGGVVIITTKRGKQGKAKVSFSQTFGIRRPISLLGTRGLTESEVGVEFGAADQALFAQNGETDYEKELYDHTRFLTTTRINISGGDGTTDYFIGATYKNEEGLVDNTGYEKGSFRFNVGQKFTDWLDIYLTNNYINSTADRGLFNNGNTNTTVGYAQAFTKPWENLFPDANGIYPAIPAVGSNLLETVALITNRENVNRYIGGGTLTLKILRQQDNTLNLVLRGGLDQYTLRTTGIFPQQLSFYRNPGTLQGVLISGSTVNTTYNLSAILVHSYYMPSGLNFTTQLGNTLQDFDLNTVITTSTGLNGSQTSLDQATNIAVLQNREPQQDKGFFFQEEVNYQDKIIGTIGVRADKSTNNGDADKFYFYPKANLALNIHEFDFWNIQAISTLKPRIAYGEAGRFAKFPDRFTLLEPTIIGGSSGLFTDDDRGNTVVEPENQKELEFGVDLGFLDGRVNLDVTYYIKTIDDLLLQVEVATSTGFVRQVLNAGKLQNQGLEIGLSATPVSTDQFRWNSTVNFWKNSSEVTRLDVPAFNLGGFAASLGQYRIQEGESATQIVGTLDPSDTNIPVEDTLGLGGFRRYGNAEPDFNMSFINTLTYGNFELSFLIHWKQGGEGINLSTLLYDLGGLTWDFDDITLDPAGVERNGDYRLNQWFAGNSGSWIEDNGYVRLREIGLYYNLPKNLFADIDRIRIGVSGRNLINIFDYNSYDPEVSNFGGNVLANTVEVTPYPTSKFYNFHLNVTF